MLGRVFQTEDEFYEACPRTAGQDVLSLSVEQSASQDRVEGSFRRTLRAGTEKDSRRDSHETKLTFPLLWDPGAKGIRP